MYSAEDDGKGKKLKEIQNSARKGKECKVPNDNKTNVYYEMRM